MDSPQLGKVGKLNNSISCRPLLRIVHQASFDDILRLPGNMSWKNFLQTGALLSSKVKLHIIPFIIFC